METPTTKAEAYQALVQAREAFNKAADAMDASSEKMIVARRNGTFDDMRESHMRISTTYMVANRKLGRAWSTYKMLDR